MNTARLRTKRMIVPAVAAAAIGVGGAAWASTGGGAGLQGGEAEDAGRAATQAVGEGTVTEVELEDGRDGYEVEVQKTDGTAVEVRVGKDLKVLGQQTDDDVGDDSDDSDEASTEDGDEGNDETEADERPLSDSQRDSATKAAVDAVGEGTITDVETDDDAGGYEVDVVTSDGTEWEVNLDSAFRVLEKSVDD